MSEDIKEVMFAPLYVYVKLKIKVFFHEHEKPKYKLWPSHLNKRSSFSDQATQMYARNYSVTVTVSLSNSGLCV